MWSVDALMRRWSANSQDGDGRAGESCSLRGVRQRLRGYREFGDCGANDVCGDFGLSIGEGAPPALIEGRDQLAHRLLIARWPCATMLLEYWLGRTLAFTHFGSSYRK